jgi:hypothetical protein
MNLDQPLTAIHRISINYVLLSTMILGTIVSLALDSFLLSQVYLLIDLLLESQPSLWLLLLPQLVLNWLLPSKAQ